MEEKIVGKLYNGFELLEKRDLKDIYSKGFLFEHKKSGARLLYISNDDDNKVFSISFRTPPHNNTGLPHILEHSVLCGSRKYKAKEPFVELLKSSLNTYLNAMTFSDKTMYPIASRNSKDFMNLMDVYMDAVFYPMIYDRPEIFLQEGWHYGLEDINKPLTYKGVVYNEMKGAYSSADHILNDTINKSLFPDNQYSMSSGGDPKNIPDLSYEEFLAFHKKYYHPSNSYIYLYGNDDMDKHLKYLNEEYLQNFNKIEIDSKIKFQEPFKQSVEASETYSIAAEEDNKDKTYLSLSFIAGLSTSAEHILSLDILNYILTQTSASPIKKALLNAGIGKSVYGYLNSNIYQPEFTIIAENANKEDKEKFKETIYTVLVDLVKNGIDKKLIEGAINIFEFTLREADYGNRPKGLTYNIQALSSWLYDNDPMIFMDYNKYILNIKSALTTNYFELLIDKYLLQNKHCSLVVVSPEKNLEAKIEEELMKKLEDNKKSMTEEQINKIIEREVNLKKYHQTPDTKEILEQIPILELKDIDKKATEIPIEVIEKEDYKILFHAMDTNKIIYLDLIFDTTTVAQEIIPYISLLSNIIGKVNTKNYSYEQLSNEISISTGGIKFNAEVYAARDNTYYPKFTISTKVLASKLPELMELLDEIINNTLYDDNKRIIEILKEYKSNMLNHMLGNGHATAARRAASNIFQSNKYEECISNISYYEFLSQIEKDIDNNIEDIKQKLIQTSKYIFNKKNLIVNVTLESENKNLFQTTFKKFENNLANQNKEIYKYDFDKKYNREAFLTASKIHYVAKAVNYKDCGYEFDGSLMVLQTILDLDYLWNEVRVQGGAYGVSISIRYGYILMSSYRDPNIKKTLEVYDDVSKYLINFNADEREMTKYIIGTINSLDYVMSCPTKGKVSAIRYITGVTQEQIQKDRDEVLETTPDKLKSYIKMFNDIMKQNNIAVIGNENSIKKNKDLFDNLNVIFQS